MRKGCVPKMENVTHASVTTRNESRRESRFSALRPAYLSRIAPNRVMMTEIANAKLSSSSKYSAMPKHESIRATSMKSSEPRILYMMRKLITN